jgi:hypothetical protein
MASSVYISFSRPDYDADANAGQAGRSSLHRAQRQLRAYNFLDLPDFLLKFSGRFFVLPFRFEVGIVGRPTDLFF